VGFCDVRDQYPYRTHPALQINDVPSLLKWGRTKPVFKLQVLRQTLGARALIAWSLRVTGGVHASAGEYPTGTRACLRAAQP
jgi:hypothetical protein